VSPEVFDAYERLYAYDPLPLDLRQVAQDDSSPHWRREQVTVAAAYGGERLPIVVFVPKAARPPYQAVVYSPASDAVVIRSSARMSLVLVDFVVRSGRLLVYPIIKGTFERGATAGGRLAHRDLTVQRAKDIRRAVDYVLSRPDVDAGRLAFYGASLGAQDGLVAPALEPRFKAIVLFAGGLTRGEEPPEIDTFQFVPRITAPTLMVNGREDFDAPLETAQKPLFEALGARAADKKHVIVDGGHIPTRFADVIRAILDWLDERFGPVAR
jgi:pimeloyl-ACP methyl ester carboxylesterase